METTNINDLSTQELEALLAEKKKKDRESREAKKQEYEKNRDSFVTSAITKASVLHQAIADFKSTVHDQMNEQQAHLEEYGGIRKGSKGGFSVCSSDGGSRIRRIRATEPSWDERSTKAISLIQDFLADTVKKKDKNLYDILISFIARNANGDLEYNKVMNLLQHEDKYKDPRWIEGLKLIRESYSVHLKAYNYQFQVKDENTGKWTTLDLNFSSL